MNIFEVLLLQPLANGLALFYKLFGGNMGLAIIGFSVVLKLALNPFTKKSLENMKRMQELRPALQKLQARHKGDRAKQMQAQSDFYKEHNFNPGAGCLPQIAQLVVLYAFYGVFSQVLTAGENITATFNNFLYEPVKFAADTHINTQFLYLDITKPDVLNIPGIPVPLPGVLLILAAISQVISAKIAQPYIKAEEKIAKATKDSADDMTVAMQSSMLVMMPLLTLVIGMSFPAGLALYWLVFSILQAYQQYQITGLGGLTSWLKRINMLQ